MRSFLTRMWEGWKRVAHVIGDFQARVILTIFYAVLVLPFGLLVRLLADPLHIRHQPHAWQDRPTDVRDAEWARRQW
jgi:hypothetical protein